MKYIGLLVILCVFGARAFLYEEEIGVNDWSKENVGKITNAHFHITPSKKAIIVSTEENAIAALNWKTGEIGWRQLLFKEEPLIKMASKSGYVVTLSKTVGSAMVCVRFWDSDGLLLWDDSLLGLDATGQIADATFVADMDGDNVEDVAVAASRSFEVRSGKTGAVIFQKERSLEKSQMNALTTYVAANKDSVFIVSALSTTELAWASFEMSTKILKSDKIVVSTTAFNPQAAFMTDQVVALLGQNNEIVTYSLTSPTEKLTLTQLSKFSSQRAEAIISGINNIVLVKMANSILALRVDQTGVEQLSEFKASAAAIASEDNSLFIAAATAKDKLELFDVAARRSQTISFSPSIDRGTIAQVFLSVSTRKEGGHGYRILLVTQDNAASLLQDESIVWQREEALASITKTEFMDLPSPHVFDTSYHTLSDNENDPFITRFLYRLKAQVQQVQELFVGSPVAPKDQKTKAELTKDTFGLRQLLLLMTKPGKMFALHSDDGSLVWSKLFDGSKCDFFVTRTSAFYPPEAIVLCQKNSLAQVSYINPLTGEETQKSSFPYEIVHTIAYPHHDAHGNHFLMVVDTNNKIHVLPENSEARALFQSPNNTLFYHTVNTASSVIQGHSIGEESSPFTFSSTKVWTVSFPLGETISAVSYPSWQEKVSSPTRVLGDRTANRKYINKNMIAVATVKATPGKDSSVNVYLIDTVTGSIIHQAYQPKASGPVHIVQSENWVVYHYWSIQGTRYEFSVMELYEKDLDWYGETYSSYQPRDLDVWEQSYIFPSGISTLAVSSTTRGLSTKQILVGMPSGQIFTIPKPWLDPRRPTKAELPKVNPEEGLVPYQPVIPIFHKNFITYYKKIGNLRDVKTHGALLESTSMLVAYGIDLFFARTYPSNTFDILNPDFNYFALIVTTVGVFVATVITSRLSRKNDLARMWR